MSSNQVIIQEQTRSAAYVRRYNGATYDNYDAEMGTRGGTQKVFWEDSSDVMYFGADAPFYNIGVDAYSAGAYAGMAWEYKTSGGWVPISGLVADTSASFSASGYIAWASASVPTWAADTIDGKLAYWVRATVTAVTTAAYMNSVLRMLTLLPPLEVKPVYEQKRFYRDVNSVVRPATVAYAGPSGLSIVCRNPAANMAGVNLLHQWCYTRTRLWITDGANSGINPANATTDAFVRDYEGYLSDFPGNVASPSKMKPDEWTLQFAIDAATRILE